MASNFTSKLHASALHKAGIGTFTGAQLTQRAHRQADERTGVLPDVSKWVPAGVGRVSKGGIFGYGPPPPPCAQLLVSLGLRNLEWVNWDGLWACGVDALVELAVVWFGRSGLRMGS